MTSTNINVGLLSGKNSSRVLKPPGGGHSDIFGVQEGNEIVTPNKRKNASQATITSCFYHQDLDVAKPKEIAETNKTNNLDTEVNEKSTENGENGHIISDENTEPTPAVQEEQKVSIPEPPKRVRVPPGGFSSGLW